MFIVFVVVLSCYVGYVFVFNWFIFVFFKEVDVKGVVSVVVMVMKLKLEE